MDLHNRIAKVSLDLFNSLPKTGKPTAQEWTILATIVQHNTDTDTLDVVSLGTGTKCIGRNLLSPKGDILNDSHAEIICRRAFLKYLYHEIESYLQTKESTIFVEEETKKLDTKNNIRFHLFSTHVPCGDAAIFPKENNDDIGICLQEELNIKTCEDILSGEQDVPLKKMKLDHDIFRTGAKCLENETKQDKKLCGSEFHITGVVRTKPGRGDPTLSVSCSDKIARWTFVGIQGALLSLFLEKPIYLSSIIIAGNVPFSEEAITRALFKRFKTTVLHEPYKHTIPVIYQSNLNFEFHKSDSKQPCPSSIIWFKHFNKVEVAVEGRKQGVTKKNKNKKSGRLIICKKELFFKFQTLISEYELFQYLESYKNLTYFETKSRIKDYCTAWNLVKNDIFGVWTNKDKNLLNFECND